MKRFAHISLLVVLFVILLACAVPALAGASSPAAAGPVRLGDPPPSAQADWTVALYVDADNNLYRMWRRFDVPELERLALTARVNVVALVDKPGRTGVDLVRLGGGREELLAHYSERDFGDPSDPEVVPAQDPDAVPVRQAPRRRLGPRRGVDRVVLGRHLRTTT